jgi:hypothetical protein
MALENAPIWAAVAIFLTDLAIGLTGIFNYESLNSSKHDK